MSLTLSLCSVISIGLVLPIVAQKPIKTTDNSDQAIILDQSRETMFNSGNPNSALVSGGAFYINNPPPLYEFDVEKAYLSTDFTNLIVVLIDGKQHSLSGRIRTVDQKVEISREDGIYELDNRMFKTVTTPDDKIFIASLDPSGVMMGIHLYEVAFAGKHHRLLVNYSAAWVDPPKQNMFDTSDAHKTLKPETRIYLVRAERGIEINKMNDLLDALSVEKNSPITQHAKTHHLKNNLQDYVTLLQRAEKIK